MKLKEKQCGTCKYLVVPSDARGRRVVRKDRAYQCSAPEPEEPKLPDSMREHDYKWPPLRHFVGPSSGRNCPVWEEYQKP